jgi:hypothetical protein
MFTKKKNGNEMSACVGELRGRGNNNCCREGEVWKGKSVRWKSINN